MSYQVVSLRPVRSGGTGDLIIGRRSDTGEYVVIKYLREYHIAHARRAFAREMCILARGLPGLMPLLFWDTNTERPYYVIFVVT